MAIITKISIGPFFSQLLPIHERIVLIIYFHQAYWSGDGYQLPRLIITLSVFLIVIDDERKGLINQRWRSVVFCSGI